MSLTDIRIEEDLLRLLSLIRSKSRFTACQAKTATLAQELGRTEDHVEDRLQRLVQREEVFIKTTPPRWSGSGWTRQRTIYLVSKASPAEGALMVADWAREHGRRIRLRRDAACGQLRCTPDQLDTWLRLAQADGYITLALGEDGAEFIERIGNFEAVNLPNRYCEDHWTRPEPSPDLEHKVLAFVQSRTQASPPRPPTQTEVAAHVGGSRSHINEVIAKMTTAGVLFPYQRGRRHYVASHPEVARAEAFRPDDVIAFALMALRRGPLTTKELALDMRLDLTRPLAASLRKKLKKHGVVFTPFGRQDIASLGPLPDQFRVERALKQKEKKAANDRTRRGLRKLGLHGGDEYLLNDLRLAVADLLFQEWDPRVPFLRLDLLRRTAHQFVEALSDQDLALHVRTIRAQPDGAAASREQMAREVYGSVKDAFRPHALRARSGYDGPLRQTG